MDANKFQYPRGSEWRKWDLQVQTILDDGYVCLGTYANELKTAQPEKWTAFISILGSEENAIKYDSKDYFTNATIDKKERCVNYARTFFAFLDTFYPDLACIAITDHNYEDPELLDALNKASKDAKCKIIPGVELNCGGIHMLALFPGVLYEKPTISESIKTFLVKCGVNNRIKDGVLTVVTTDPKEVINLIRNEGGIVIFPHCNMPNGLFQERGSSDRTALAEVYNHQELNLIQSQNKDACDKIAGYIPTNVKLIAKFCAHISSDARSLRDYGKPDKDGNFLWIKADPTFEGLKQITYEPVDRVFIGKEPSVIDRVRSNKTKYIRGLKMDQRNSYDGKNGVWFKNIDIEFNNELVAIIGNKGSGKSAIADVLGLLGNTRNAGDGQKNLSFLNPRKFKKKGYAENFEAQLLWEDENCVAPKVPLNQSIDPTETERVKYLPQSYFESLTNELEINGFDQTLKSVTFLHIPEEERLGLATFDDLEKAKSKNVETDLLNLKNDVHVISEKIIALEKKKHPNYRKTLQNEIDDKEKELVEHGKNKPKEVKDPSLEKSGVSDPEKDKKYNELTDLNTQYKKLESSVEDARTALKKLTKEKEDLTQIHGELVRFETQISTYKLDNKEKFRKLGLDIDQLIKSEIDLSTVKDALKHKNQAITNCQKSLKTKAAIENDEDLTRDQKDTACQESHVAQQEVLQSKIDKIKLELNKPERDFQEYKEKLVAWEAKKKEIEGTKDTPKTLEYLKNTIAYLDGDLVTDLENLRSERLVKATEILNKKKEVVNLYNLFKQSIDAQLAQDKEFAEKFKMEIEAGFKLSNNFPSKFLGFINKAKLGSFKGGEERQVKELFEEKNLLDESEIKTILKNIISSLEEDQRTEVKEDEKDREIVDQVDNPQEFYDFVFSLDYLEPIYQLKLDEKVLDELSPGEKGALLLVFYLIIDKEDIPLVIDQPEDNLDNKSVFQVLTRFIKAAKKRRQIVIVTHNPNLAVGADAEQIIYVELDKKDNHRFGYELGAIEHPEINNRIVEILEGTMPAFDNRKLKYRKVT